MIKEFKGKYYFLSNFYSSKIKYNGFEYLSAESAFQATKTTDFSEREKFTSLNPSEAKRKGRKVNLRADWESIKDMVMYNIVKIKFSNSPLKEMLLNTNSEELIEGNWWHDNYWGNCYCSKCKNIQGKNQLGKTLMRVREEVKGE